MPRKIEISHRTIIFAVFFVLLLWLVFLLKDLIIELFLALLMMTVLDPVVAWFSRKRIPKGLAVLISYVLVVGMFIGIVSLIIPAVVEQTAGFVEALPGYMERLGLTDFFSSSFLLQGILNNNFGNAPGAIVTFTLSVVNNIFSIITILVFAFYMLLSRDKLGAQLGLFFGEDRADEFSVLLDNLETRLGGWARGQMLLMLSIGFATFIGLSILGIPYALPLSILAGFFEIVPFLGPIISAIPAILIGFGIAPVTGLGVVAMAFLIQQLENYVLVPKVMEKSAGVSPLVTLIALAIGARLAGVVGAVISVPVFITVQVLAKKYLVKE